MAIIIVSILDWLRTDIFDFGADTPGYFIAGGLAIRWGATDFVHVVSPERQTVWKCYGLVGDNLGVCTLRPLFSGQVSDLYSLFRRVFKFQYVWHGRVDDFSRIICSTTGSVELTPLFSYQYGMADDLDRWVGMFVNPDFSVRFPNQLYYLYLDGNDFCRIAFFQRITQPMHDRVDGDGCNFSNSLYTW